VNSALTFGVLGIVVGCIYALTAAGLVVTYTTSGIFNFAYGAIGMVAAFTYWQLYVAWHLPQLVAVALVLFVLAPLFGIGLERFVARRIHGQSLEVTVAVTIGLLVFLLGFANLVWNPQTTTRVLPPFLPGHSVKLLSLYVTDQEVIVVAVTAAIGVGLRLFFSRTAIGVAVRAVVDSPALLSMSGTRPERVSQVSWALGTLLAALAGILLAPIQQLNINALTLVIINAFAAAMLGRLKNLPLTVAGALILGLLVSYATGYLPATGAFSEVESAIPMIMLFVVLVFLRQERLRTGVLSGLQVPRVPNSRQSIVYGLGFLAVAAVVSGQLSTVDLATASQGLVFGLILLSLVPLTGYAGQVSLCQMTFAGIGAYAMAVAGHHGSLLGLLAAAGMAGGFGAVVAIPTIRLRGIYLALATLAFASAMDNLFFNQVFGAYGGALGVARLHIPGIPTTSDRAYFMLTAVVFVLVACSVLALRRSRLGRRLAALNDSPAACGTLGLNITWTKMAIFVGSAAIAGIGGVFYGGLQHQIDSGDFQVFNSLTLILLLLIGGRNTVSGAFLGAMGFALFPVLQSHWHSLSSLQYLLTGFAAVSIGINPNGIGGQISAAGNWLRNLSGQREEPFPAEAAAAR
jgi:branched-chain amino acid transport system permease protein